MPRRLPCLSSSYSFSLIAEAERPALLRNARVEKKMVILRPCQPLVQRPNLPFLVCSSHTNCLAPFPTVSIRLWSFHSQRQPGNAPLCLVAKATPEQNLNTLNLQDIIEGDDDGFDGEGGFSTPRGGSRGRGDEKDYDRDPEFAEILGSCLDDPEKARSKVSS